VQPLSQLEQKACFFLELADVCVDLGWKKPAAFSIVANK
jgi:hypothetical protein